jgi:hypothetical protein
MNNNLQTSEQLSFWQLIQKTKIEIPIIQRDYAQGRADKTKIRKTFLNALSDALERTFIELDFVYGSNKGNSLQPLDGQQRLTTLFLLHWYVATKEGLLDTTVKSYLKKFTYKTRTSSRDFCNSLVEKGISFENADTEISTIIKDASWFFLSWEKDPTIKAMLIMLDAIHLEFKGLHDLWDKLTDETNRPITFHYIELENFGLSDDLYIKMNARGKQLSPFENFKADFTKHIITNKWDEGKVITETFSHKADTIWTDLFWGNGKGISNFDKAFIRFITSIAITSIAVENEKTEQKEKKIQNLFNYPENISAEDFNEDGYKNLYSCLDTYYNNEIPSFSFPFWNLIPEPKQSLFSITTEGNATYPQRVLFYAQTEYILKNKIFNEDDFHDWMRVVRNIVMNSTIDSASTFIGAINLIKELSQGSENIYRFLSNAKIESQTASSQVKEEIIKSKLLTIENRKDIFETEDINFCKGRIGFALYCIDYKYEENNFDNKKLLIVRKAMLDHLNNEDITNEFRRALLTVEDTNFYNYWGSWVYVVGARKRCLISNIKDLKNYAYLKDFKHYLKSLLLQLTEKELSTIIAEFIYKNEENNELPNWKKQIISDPKLLDSYCQSHHIAIPDNDNTHCYLLKVGKPRDKKSCKKIG